MTRRRNLDRLFSDWRHNRERFKKLAPAPAPAPKPAELRETKPGTAEPTS